MSVNYHAAQSRGVLFENHEKVSEQWRQEFSQYDPAGLRILFIWKQMRSICIYNTFPVSIGFA